MPVDVDVVRSRLSDVRGFIAEARRIASKEYSKLCVDERYALRYCVIALVEALVALCTHVAVEELGREPRTYRESVRLVAEHLGVECRDSLEALVGLRNILIHRYRVVDDERIYKLVKKDFKCVEELLRRVVEEWLTR